MKNIILTIMVFTVMTLTTGCSDNGVNPYSECSVIKKDIPRWEILPVIECMGIRSRYSTEEMRLIDSMIQEIDFDVKVLQSRIDANTKRFNIERQKEIDGLKNTITDTVELERQIRIVNEKWDNSIEDYTNWHHNDININFTNSVAQLEKKLRPEDRPTFTHWQETNEIPCCK
jgi:hypothetical protein